VYCKKALEAFDDIVERPGKSSGREEVNPESETKATLFDEIQTIIIQTQTK